jgi:hypothetical protein
MAPLCQGPHLLHSGSLVVIGNHAVSSANFMIE